MDDSEAKAALRYEAERIRAAEALGRSDMMLQLFNFLLERSLSGQVPKEIEIALRVFGKADTVDSASDATVRVYIHRLRRKLAAYYDGIGAPLAGRLVIPLGGYRLALQGPEPERAIEPEAAAPVVSSPPAAPTPGSARWTRRALIGTGAIGLMGVGAGIQRLIEADDGVSPVRSSVLWRNTTASPRPTLILVGDYYIFGEVRNGINVDRLVREFGINSRQDLEGYVAEHPDLMGRFVNLDLSYAPVGAVAALGTLMPLFAGGPRHPEVMPGSLATVRMLHLLNIVYVGYLSGLGFLRDPLFGVSRFKVGESYDELIDTVTGRHYLADWGVLQSGAEPRRDYAYLATFPGPNGNSITIIAGTRDTALMQAAEIAVDPVQVALIARAAGGGTAVEALYRVSTASNTNLDGSLVVAAPLAVKGMWRDDRAAHLRFPDESQR